MMPDSAAKPRLAYLFSRYPVVSQTFCDSEMLALERMGFQIEVGSLNRPPNSFRHERLDRLRAEIHYPPPPAVLEACARDPEFERLLLPLVDEHTRRFGAEHKPQIRARNAFSMARRFRQLGVAHVHVHFANRATHSALFLKQLGFPFSFTAHAQDFMFDLGSVDLLAEMAAEAEFVVAVSDFSRALLCDLCPQSADKIVRIHNGIELDDFPPSPVKQAAVLRVLSVGRLVEFKGMRHLIGACALLKRQGVAVELRIVGDGPLREALQALIRELEVEDCVTLLGVRSQEEIKGELARADVFALASVVDPKGACDILPTVITEAMACSLPVVATTVAGIPEMVADEVTGLLVPPTDEAALAAALARLAADAGERGRFGEAGRARAERLFALDVTAGDLGQRFCQLDLPEPPKRLELPFVYWSPCVEPEVCVEGPGHEMGVRWIGEQVASETDGSALSQVEFLPDASVIESIWQRRPAWRQVLEGARGAFGDHVGGSEFYQAARQAVYLADILPRRQTRHLHARGSAAVAVVWLVKKLLPDLSTSCAIEDEPALSRSLLARLLADFEMCSVSDERLRTQLGGQVADHLHLRAPFERRETRFGPLRLKRKVARPGVNRRDLEAAFLVLLQNLAPPQKADS